MARVRKDKVNSYAGRYANRSTGRSGKASALPDIATLDNVYDAIQEMIFTKDTDGRVTSVNEAFAKRITLKKEEIIGKTAFEFGTMPQEEAEMLSAADRQVMREKKVWVNRRWNTYPDGSRIFTEEIKTPILNDGEVMGLLVTIKDMTELKQAMEEVEKQNEILKTIEKVSALMLEPDIDEFEDSMYEAMRIIAEGINADWIDIWKRQNNEGGSLYMLEYAWSADRSALEADKRSDFVADDDRTISDMEEVFSKVQALNRKIRDMSPGAQNLIKINGMESARSALIMRIVVDDKYWGFISAFDMKKEREFSDNEVLLLLSSRQIIASAMTRMEITKDLMYKTEQLEYEVKSKRDFLARMSHEIRTPMNAILGMTELALRERMSNVANEHIQTVKQTGMNLLAIINDILDYSKIDSGNMDIISAKYELSSLIHDIVSIIRMKLAYTRIRFIVDVDSKLPCELVGDEGKIRQVLINLLSNAVKYTQKGFIKLTVKGDKSDDGTLSLTMAVTDSGIGIREEDREKLFRDYVQVDSEKNAGIEGVGLGLSITRGLVSAMGGSISLSSVYGEGSEFTVVIPQKISKTGRLAEVREPSKSATLVFERRSLHIDALVQSITNLDVRCDVVDNSGDALRKMGTGLYSYIIGSKELLAEIRKELDALDTDFQVIGIAEFGDEVDNVWRTLLTPIHSISLANVYNGEADHYAYNKDDEPFFRFSAPEAKVLVVDDIATNLKVAAGLLSIFDVNIDISGSGAEAVELARENRYDVIFMDHRMPGMDGVEAMRLIRALGDAADGGAAAGNAASGDAADGDYFKEVPIVALTANVMPDMREMLFEAGFNDFVAKPIETVVLGDVLRKWIPKSKQRRYFAVDAGNDKTAAGLDEGMSLSIKGVNVEKGLLASGGRKDIYLDILLTFADEAAERLSQLNGYIEAGNIRMYTATIHALKGALANIGADELSAIAAKLETAGDRKDVDFIEKNNERFISNANRLLGNIKEVLAETAKSAGDDKKTGEKETGQFIATLEELKKALADMDAGTMNKALERLPADAVTEQGLSAARLISKRILMAEYDDAEKMIDDLVAVIRE